MQDQAMNTDPASADPVEPASAQDDNPSTPPQAPQVPQRASFAEMRLKVGDSIPLEPTRRIAGGRANARVVGWVDGLSLLVTMPENSAGRVLLQEGEQVLLRAFTGKSAFAFRTVVQRAAYQPLAYLHLDFPAQVERVQIRNSFRYRVNLPCNVSSADGSAAPGRLVNIGTTGALLEMVTAPGASAEELRIALSFELHAAPVTLDLRARVRTAKNLAPAEGTPRHHLGVEFLELQASDRLVLGSLLWYQMLEHPENAT